MKFSYWKAPAQGVYSGKTHIIIRDGDASRMLCGKSVTASWVCEGNSADSSRFICRSCEERRTALCNTEVKRALEGDERAKDSDGVPVRYHDYRFEYMEGMRRGQSGKHLDFNCAGINSADYDARKTAWEAGVRAGRKLRRQQTHYPRGYAIEMRGKHGNR